MMLSSHPKRQQQGHMRLIQGIEQKKQITLLQTKEMQLLPSSMTSSSPSSPSSSSDDDTASKHSQFEVDETTVTPAQTTTGKADGIEHVTNLKCTDVLLGRGVGPNEHQGNVRFREIVSSFRPEYLATNKRKAKDKIAHKTIQKIKAKEGRFLKKLTSEEARPLGAVRGVDVYAIVDETIVLEKTKQALRFVGRKKPNTNTTTSKDSSGGVGNSEEQNISSSSSVANMNALPDRAASVAVTATSTTKKAPPTADVADTAATTRSVSVAREGPMSLRSQSGMIDSMSAYGLQAPLHPTVQAGAGRSTHDDLRHSLQLLEAYQLQQQQAALSQHPHHFLLSQQQQLQQQQHSASLQQAERTLLLQAELANLANVRSPLTSAAPSSFGHSSSSLLSQDPYASLRHMAVATRGSHNNYPSSITSAAPAATTTTQNQLLQHHQTLFGRSMLQPSAAAHQNPISMEAILQTRRIQEQLETLAYSSSRQQQQADSSSSSAAARDSAITTLLRRVGGYPSALDHFPDIISSMVGAAAAAPSSSPNDDASSSRYHHVNSDGRRGTSGRRGGASRSHGH